MAPDVPVSWLVVRADGDGPVVRYLGGGTVLLNAQDLYRFGDPEVLGAAIFLTLIEARRQTVDQLLASRGERSCGPTPADETFTLTRYVALWLERGSL